MSNATTAATIRDQIGNPAAVMMGARDFVAIENGLQFKVGRGARGKGGAVTHIRITLTPEDLYVVETIRFNMRAAEISKTLETIERVYADQLRTVLEGATGFYLSL